MKSKVVVEKEPMFLPFDITITVESPEELINLWHRFNNDKPEQIPASMDKTLPCPAVNVYGIWEKLGQRIDEEIEAGNITKQY
jgi:hypothetical protein